MTAILLRQLRANAWALHENVRDVTSTESLAAPPAGGNSMNWVVGHIVATRNGFLQTMFGNACLDPVSLAIYERGAAAPDPGVCLPWDDLLQGFDRTQPLVLDGITSLGESALMQDSRGESLRDRLALLSFHEAYHIGQIGLLRRLLGKPGAIA